MYVFGCDDALGLSVHLKWQSRVNPASIARTKVATDDTVICRCYGSHRKYLRYVGFMVVRGVC